VSALFTACLLVFAGMLFKRLSRRFADEL